MKLSQKILREMILREMNSQIAEPQMTVTESQVRRMFDQNGVSELIGAVQDDLFAGGAEDDDMVKQAIISAVESILEDSYGQEY
jgi:hypothetical protein